MITSVLTESGYTTGLYTSPHLQTWQERIRIGSELISEEELAALVTRFKPEIEAVNQRATYGRLTTFEILTSLAFAHFAAGQADFQVLEVGMGGRYDATNVIVPEVSIITPVSFDHTEVLGDTLAKIAAEKAAIIKPGGTAVIAPQADEAERVIAAAAAEAGAQLIRVGRDVTGHDFSFDGTRQSCRVKGRLGDYRIALPLLGRYQITNAVTAVAALEVLKERGFKISPDSISRGLAQVNWPGRLQVIGHHPTVVVDGAHNPGAVQELEESLRQYFEFERLVLVAGVSEDKDMKAIVEGLSRLTDCVVATRSRHPRARSAESVAAEFARQGVTASTAADIPAALDLALSLAGEKDLVCVVGSLFTVAEAIAAMPRPGG
jgi:dihydrofolate synthase/folylpolyglutamate synthase